MERRMVRICKAGDQLPDSVSYSLRRQKLSHLLLRTSRQMRPSLSMLGW